MSAMKLMSFARNTTEWTRSNSRNSESKVKQEMQVTLVNLHLLLCKEGMNIIRASESTLIIR